MTRKIPAEQARQGRKGVTILKLLVASLGLALFVWLVVALYYSGNDNETLQTGATSQMQNNPPRADQPI